MSPSPAVTVEFDPTSYTVSESGGFANITVVKRGESTLAVSVEFNTAVDSAVCEYTKQCNSDVVRLYHSYLLLQLGKTT